MAKLVQYSRACGLWETLLGEKGDTEMDKQGHGWARMFKEGCFARQGKQRGRVREVHRRGTRRSREQPGDTLAKTPGQ